MSKIKDTDAETDKPKKKKVNDIRIFIYGWIASFLAVLLPLSILTLTKSLYPSFSRENEDKVTIIAYLLGAFFSGMFTIYRVHRKGVDKDEEIEELKKENESLKKAYRAVLPKKRILNILTGILKTPSDTTAEEIKQLIIKKIEETNSDCFMDSTWEEMIHFLEKYAEFNEFKQPMQSDSNAKSTKSPLSNTYSFESQPANFSENKIR